MLSLPLKPQHCIVPFCLVIISLLLAIIGPASGDLLAYNRTEIAQGQIWRIITGHFLHTNFIHFLLNMAGLLLLWALHGQYYKSKQYLTIICLLCVGTSTGLYFFSPNLHWYVGLSGVLHGLFILGAYFDIRAHLKTGWILLLGVWVKILHEQIYGASEDVAKLIDANVAIDAHLFGTLSGSFVIFYYMLTVKKRR
jgi:rhomboid family GlyGly-CTERM serine protease